MFLSTILVRIIRSAAENKSINEAYVSPIK
uniref:Uncharacterized protein n=1 Tax=Anguilla anguilla TaxID=7936 RepID=A0A0E9VKV3_ANGAN